jgi:short-subunit dehydrogenase
MTRSGRWKQRQKTAFITGAANGMGHETARQLVARGYNVALVDLPGAALLEAANELGTRALPVEADVTDVSSLERAADETVRRFGGIDVTVANAGVGILEPVLAGDRRQQQRMLDINLGGVLDTIRVTAPQIIERRGYVLSIASAAAIGHLPLLGVYAATKAGVEALSNALRIELLGLGVQVGVGYFLFVQTPMLDGPGAQHLPLLERGLMPPMNRHMPVQTAGGAIVRGIERRSRRVYAPSLIGAMLPLRQILVPSFEVQMRLTGVAKAIQQIQPLADRQPVQPDSPQMTVQNQGNQ